ncbi:MAG: hypothetical protein RIB71_23890 [Imperialibacter sp.]|uniref:hypothetical protein n=1 Tax=Imperialibacter sp. TaxID=2038411 RepID=UPI0032EDED0E
MKKFQLAFLLTLLAGSAYAQFEDTKFVVGGAVDYNSDLFPNSSSLGITPSLAKTIKSNALLGMSMGYNTSVRNNNLSNVKQTVNSINAGIYYQRFYSLAENIFFNWQALAGVNFINIDDNSSMNDMKGYNLRVVPGFSWQVMSKLILNASLGGASYSYQSNSSESPGYSDDSSSNRIGIHFNNPQFSLIYLIK